jgi:hypothetical protein
MLLIFKGIFFKSLYIPENKILDGRTKSALVGGHYAQNYPQGGDKLAQVVIPISFFPGAVEIGFTVAPGRVFRSAKAR